MLFSFELRGYGNKDFTIAFLNLIQRLARAGAPAPRKMYVWGCFPHVISRETISSFSANTRTSVGPVLLPGVATRPA